MRSFLLGLLIGLVVSLAGVGLVAARTIPKKMQAAREGWEPQPILTLTRDVDAGAKLEDGDLAELRVPSQFIPASAVQPADRLAVTGRALTLGMVKGDVLSWPLFSQQESRAQVRACVADARTAFQEAGVLARDAAIQAFVERGGPPPPSPSLPVLSFQFDAKGKTTPVVVVTQEVKEGDRIPASALELRRIPYALVTPSLVPGESLKDVVGALAVVAMQPGDPLRWQFLDDPEQPRSIGSCQLQAASAADKARADVARARAEAFFGVAKEGR